MRFWFVSICNSKTGFWAPGVTDRDEPSAKNLMSQSVTSGADFAELLLQIETNNSAVA